MPRVSYDKSAPWRLRQNGAALLLVMLIAMTIGLAFLFQNINTGGGGYAREEATQTALSTAKAALIGYAATYRETHPNTVTHLPDEPFGQLPCPDIDNTGIAQLNCGDAGETMIGRLPYKTLGLSDIRGAGGECLWYVVSGSHKNNPKTGPLNWDTRGQIRAIDSAGISVADPSDAQGGAVAVIIAPGAPINAQARTGGNFPCSGNATNALNSYLEGAGPDYSGYADPQPNPAIVTLGKPNDAHNNDQGAWITAKELFAPIAKRSDLFVTATSSKTTIFDEFKSCLDAQAMLPTPSVPAPRNNGNTKTFLLGNAALANFPDPLLGCGFSTGFDKAWPTWKSQFAYVVCNNQSAGCLTVDGSSCRGALLFSGRQANGNPRTAADNFDVITSNTFLESPNLASYLSAGSTYSGIQPYDGNNPSKDIAVCLKPDANTLSFQDNFSQLAPVSVNFAGQSMVTTDAESKTLTLGEPNLTGNTTGSASELLFGCSWFGTPLAFGNTLRAFFRYKIINAGLGYVFTVADADSSRNPSTSMCGRGDSSLGYSGLPNDGNAIPGLTVAPIHYPKIGLEIDTTKDVSRKDPNSSHMAIVYWGNPTVDDDDNIHEAPTVAVGGSPTNPAAVNRSIVRNTDAYRYVRLEIVRIPDASGHTYTTKAWVLNILPPDFDNLTADFDEAIAPAQIHTTGSIANLSSGNEALRSIWVGFSNAASRTSDQEIQITNFAIRTSL